MNAQRQPADMSEPVRHALAALRSGRVCEDERLELVDALITSFADGGDFEGRAIMLRALNRLCPEHPPAH